LKNNIQHYWYALYTKPKAEKKVYSDLLKRGIEAYLPLRKTLNHWTDRKKWIETPIINSYVFVRILFKDYKQVFDTPGVMSYVSKNRIPVAIPDEEIEVMKRTVESNLSFNVEPSQIQKGQIITITSGPLKGISGEVFEVQNDNKVHIRISHIGYTLVVTLDDETTKA
jgi:transcription antitermination factor NusG